MYKRILLSDTYYLALCQPNVTVVPEAVAALDEGGVVAASGRRVDADVVVYGNGFAIQSLTRPGAPREMARTCGRLGLAGGLQGHVHQRLPDSFVLLGPNTGLGHSSMIT